MAPINETDPTGPGDTASSPVVALLEADIDQVLGSLRAEDSQFWRRACARLFLSYAESLVYFLKQSALEAAGRRGVKLTGAERAMLADERYEVTNSGKARTTTYHAKLRSNFRFAFEMAARTHEVDLVIDYNDQGWSHFKKAIGIRNRIAHPRSLEALEIGDMELESLIKSVFWVRRQYSDFQARTQNRE